MKLERERDEARKKQILQVLDDPNFALKYSPPQKPIAEIAKDLLNGKSVAVGHTVSGNQVDLSPFAGGALAQDGMPARNPFRLAHTILHEMVHVVQIRHEGAPISSVAAHSGTYENAAYRWEHSFSEADKSLFHSNSWTKLKLPCANIQKN
ncbi:MAG TPA: hypothetical protein VNN73_16090 [Blastocatellia bacterium]|nr:hypothetical protein [Blastocatellia bacterium]